MQGENAHGGEQERIEQARSEAARQRRRDRARLERYVELGLDPDTAETVIEFEHFFREQRARSGVEQPSAESEQTTGTPHGARDETEPVAVERPAEARERSRPGTPRIYIASLADYNSGRLLGDWIDADQTPEELQRDIGAMLARSAEPVAEEWAIHDYEGFGRFRVGEYESLTVVSAVARGIVECGQAFAAYASWAGTSEEALRAFDSCYLGYWPSLEAYARDLADDFGWEAQLRELPEAMQPYVAIDYAQLAQFVDSALTVIEGGGGIYVFNEP